MQIRELDMPAEDVDALVAYLRLLQQLMETVRVTWDARLLCAAAVAHAAPSPQAPPELSVQRVQQLEGKCLEGQSIMRLFFTLFDFPARRLHLRRPGMLAADCRGCAGAAQAQGCALQRGGRVRN